MLRTDSIIYCGRVLDDIQVVLPIVDGGPPSRSSWLPYRATKVAFQFAVDRDQNHSYSYIYRQLVVSHMATAKGHANKLEGSQGIIVQLPVISFLVHGANQDGVAISTLCPTAL